MKEIELVQLQVALWTTIGFFSGKILDFSGFELVIFIVKGLILLILGIFAFSKLLHHYFIFVINLIIVGLYCYLKLIEEGNALAFFAPLFFLLVISAAIAIYGYMKSSGTGTH